MIQSISEKAGTGPDLKNTKRTKIAERTYLFQQGDKLPPNSHEGEQGVLGCVLINPKDCYQIAKERLPDSQAFYSLAHQCVWDSMDEKTDLIILQQRLKDKGLLDQVGGIPYLSELQDSVPSAANLTYYLEIVEEKFLLRQMVKLCTEMVGRVYEWEGHVDSLLDDFERDCLAVASKRLNLNLPSRVDALIPSAIQILEENFRRNGSPLGLCSGFKDLDFYINGMRPGNMIVIAARPSFGKTSLCMNIVEHVTIEQKRPVGVFSLEMDKQELTLRLIASQARVEWQSITNDFIAKEQMPKIVAATDRLRKAPLYIDDTGGLSISQLKARARRMVQNQKCELIVIDYLQLIHGVKKRGDNNRNQEISDISNAIKALGKELQVPIIILSQLNREIEKEKNRPPRMSDLRDSGAIEQDADIILMPWPKPKQDSGSEDVVNCYLRIAKQRNGRSNFDIPLVFYKKITRFEQGHVASEEDVP